MSSYERVLAAARATPLSVPAFDAIAEASERARAKWIDDDRDARVRARRWLWFAAGLWLALAPVWAMRELHEQTIESFWSGALSNLVGHAPLVLLMLWVARLTRQRRFRAAVLTRGIVASCLVLAMVIALLTPWLELVAIAIAIAIATGRSLQLLGVRDLDGREDDASEFAPIKFRGVLTLALIMSCTDAMTLLLASAVTVVSAVWQWWSFPQSLPGLPQELVLLLGSTAIMLVNIWGLSRLRTWALLSNMLSNVVIALLAVNGMLNLSSLMSALLATTCGIQLLLPLPILATALGHPLRDHHDRALTILLRVVVPALIVITIVGGLLPLESCLLRV